MITAVLSDLHLGSPMSVLATPPVRRRLIAELEHADQIVLLGDLVALRDGPVSEVLEAARPFFEELAAALRGRRVLIVPGNHDYQLAEPLLERRRLDGTADSLAAQRVVKPGATGLTDWIARRMNGAEIVLAYPGLWIRPDVYATHGHYLDCHLTVPRLDCLLAALMKPLIGGLPARGLKPADYEAALAPVYAFVYSLVQTADTSRTASGAPSVKLGQLLTRQGWYHMKGGDRRGRLRARLLGAMTVIGAVAAINRAGLGPFKADLSAEELGRAGVRAMAEVVVRLEIDADHVIFGHTHRAGPLDGEAGWTLPAGTRLFNAGSWVYSSALIGSAAHRSPYWPGTCALVGEHGPPELRSLLHEATPAGAVA